MTTELGLAIAHTAFKDWLGDEGVRFFTDVHREHGRLAVILRGYGMPHPVHFREGMRVRNWMREHLTVDQTDTLDDAWEGFVLAALGLKSDLVETQLLLPGE